MSTNHAASLVSLALLGLLVPARALATGSTCPTTCTPGAVQCDGTGSTETCVLQSSSGDANCPAAAELVYVVDEDNTFSSFTPGPPSTFNDIGVLSCPDYNGGTPFSMSVDRSGTAWIIFSDGELFQVNTTNLNCTDTNYNAGDTGYSNFGMGFVSQTAGGTTDNLFIANVSPLELGILNTSSLGVSTVGSLTGSPELTGTGSAILYGFFPDSSNPRVSELNQSTGAESDPMPMSALAGSPEAWAFAFYGGDFYVFLMRDSDNSTNVWHLNGSTGAVNEALSNTGRTIVGAGESTCVPVSTCYDWQVTACPANQACSSGVCSPTCTDACTLGATQCDSNGDLDTCGGQASGCLGWSAAPCPGGQICSSGACILNCANRCTEGATQCDASGDLDTCAVQANGCTDWNAASCPSPQTCSGGACVTTCTNQCTEGAEQCSGSNATETCSTQANGCTDWTVTACPGTQDCIGGACCTCVAGATLCDSSGNIEVCTPDPANTSCPTWVTSPCSDGTCIDGACFTDCTIGAEIGTCPSGTSCVAIPAGSSSDYCAGSAADGGYVSPNPPPTTSTSAGNGSATAGNGASNTTGGTSGTVGGAGGTTGHSASSGGVSGSTGTHPTTGTVGGIGATTGGSNGGLHTTGLSGSTGGTVTTSTKDGTVSAGGCNCQSGDGASLLALVLIGLGSASRRRRATSARW